MKSLMFVLSVTLTSLLGGSVYSQEFPTLKYPLTVDLRPSLSPVAHQGYARGTCHSFAATALMESLIFQKTGQKLDLSVSFTYWSGRQVALSRPYTRQTYANSDGLPAFIAVEGLRSGAVLNSVWPYNPNPQPNFTGIPPANLLNNILPYKADLDFMPRSKIASFLTRYKRPVAININWYPDLISPTGDLLMPTPAQANACAQGNSSICGGHVILLVGYDATSRRFIFRNSHGTEFGINGYGTVSEEFLLKQCELCAYEQYLPQYQGEAKDFVEKGLMGVSAHLIPMTQKR